MTVESRAMHDRERRILKDLQHNVVQQRPNLAAEMESQLRIFSQAIQATIQEERSSLAIPNTGRRRSEENLYGDCQGSPPSDNHLMHRPRSRSSAGFPNHKDQGEPWENTTSLQGVLSISQRQVPQSEPEAKETSPISSKGEPTVSLQLSQRQKGQCKRPCSCQCHRSSKFKTPDFLRQVTGQLLVGYSGISKFTLPCNEHACAQRQKALIRIQYSFPFWSLIQRMLTVVSYSGGARGPEQVLRMSRIRPGLDEVFIQVQSGNISRLQQLFSSGNASPMDASDTGWSLLHYALTAGQLSTAKFLKDAGADIHAESAGRETPFDVSWNRILSGYLDTQSELLLRDVFNEDDELDRRQFTPLHKIVLEMIGKSLADELEISTARIDALDNSGYTPLAWASA